MALLYMIEDQIFVKEEATKGTDATIASADVIACDTLDIMWGDFAKVNRARITGEYDNPADVTVSKFAGYTGSHQIYGTGDTNALDEEPKWTRFLKACNFQSVATADTLVTYTNRTGPSSQTGVTVQGYSGGDVLVKSTGAVASQLSFVIDAGQKAMMNWGLAGSYVQPTDGTLSSGTIDAVIPVGVNEAETVLTIDSTVFSLSKCTINLNPEIDKVDESNRNEVVQVNMAPDITLTIEMENVATKNLTDLAEKGTPVSFKLTQGTESGNIVEWSHDALSFQTIKPVNIGKRKGLELTGKFTTNSSGVMLTVVTK